MKKFDLREQFSYDSVLVLALAKMILRLNNVANSAGDGDESTSAEKKKSDTVAANSSHESISSGSSFTGDTSRLKGAHNVDIQGIASLLKPLDVDLSNDKNSTHIQLKFGNLNIGKLSNLNIGQNTQPPPPAPKPSEPKPSEQPPVVSEKELPLFADFKFESAESSSHTWEKCVSTILIDKSVKKLWQELQQPYGNQSSFVRHLIMLEKYWRSGALQLADSAEPSAVKYINSVKNRVASLGSSTPPKLAPASTVASVAPPSTTSLRAVTAPSPVKVAPTAPPPAASVPAAKPETSVRHASTPPPLLKLGSFPMARGAKPNYSVATSAVRTLPGNISLVAVKSARSDVGSVEGDDGLAIASQRAAETVHPERNLCDNLKVVDMFFAPPVQKFVFHIRGEHDGATIAVWEREKNFFTTCSNSYINKGNDGNQTRDLTIEKQPH
ncbi:hypothetical protein ACFE04_026204 [Oxalis oulophora]